MPMPYSFSELLFEKSEMTKEVTASGEPVTFYYFNITRGGEKLGSFKKRFRMFDEFNQVILL